MKKLILICLIGLGALGYFYTNPQALQTLQSAFSTGTTVSVGALKDFPSTLRTEFSPSDIALQQAFQNRQGDLQIGGSGKVIKILPDDLTGSRHQRFILKLATGQTLLVAHNIDLAPRINSINVGDQVDFYGEYEWNSKGGVIHWTHHDPNGRHEEGWLVHDGNIYK